MGGGSWDTKLYTASATTRKLTDTPDFAYHASTASAPRSAWKAAPELDPIGIKDSVNGVRESRDSDEHPESVPIAVFFDVTGSMQQVPPVLQTKLGFLMEYVIGRGGVPHPQVLVGAIGDATCDQVPLQISQFESDNRVDEWLRKLFLEGAGGGHDCESYGLALFVSARLMECDSWLKRGKKGYLFTIGDERSWPVKASEVERIFGLHIQEPQIEIADLVREVQEKWHLFHIIPRATAHGSQASIFEWWRELLGQHVLRIEDADKICELVASQIALMEGADFSDIRRDVGDSVAGALVPASAGSGWNAPAAQITGQPQAPTNTPGAASRF